MRSAERNEMPRPRRQATVRALSRFTASDSEEFTEANIAFNKKKIVIVNLLYMIMPKILYFSCWQVHAGLETLLSILSDLLIFLQLQLKLFSNLLLFNILL